MGISSVSRIVDGFHSSFRSEWFTDHSPGGGKLGAVVLWKRRRVRVAPWTAPSLLHRLVGIFFVRTMLLPLLWRRGFEAWIHGSFEKAAEHEADRTRGNPAGRRWSSTSGSGADLIGFDERLRIVGFRGRVFGPAPEGHAILLTLEDDESLQDGIRLAERFVPIPDLPDLVPIDRSLPKEARIKALLSQRRARELAWSAAMDQDAEYRRFMGQ